MEVWRVSLGKFRVLPSQCLCKSFPGSRLMLRRQNFAASTCLSNTCRVQNRWKFVRSKASIPVPVPMETERNWTRSNLKNFSVRLPFNVTSTLYFEGRFCPNFDQTKTRASTSFFRSLLGLSLGNLKVNCFPAIWVSFEVQTTSWKLNAFQTHFTIARWKKVSQITLLFLPAPWNIKAGVLRRDS